MALTPEEQAELEALQSTLPELTTQFEMLSRELKSPAQTSPVEEPVEEPTRFERFKRGMGLSAAQTAVGAQSLVTDVDDYQKDALKEWNQDVDNDGGWGLTGQVAGDVLQLAVPAVWAARGAKILGGGARGVLGAETALNAGYGAMQAGADEDTSRAGGALQGAVGTLLGAGIGKVLGKSVQGIAQSDAAKRVQQLGIQLTPAQASEGPIARGFEFTSSYLPFLSQSIKRQRAASVDDFNRIAMQDAAPDNVTISEGGERGFRQLKKAYDDAYNEAWEKSNDFKLNDIATLMQNSAITLDPFGKEGKRVHSKIFDALERLYEAPRGDRSKEVRRLDKILREESQRSFDAKDWGLHDAIDVVRDDLTTSVGEEASDALKKLNNKYMSFKIVRDAATSPSALERGDYTARGYFTPQELMRSIAAVEGRKAGSKNVIGSGEAQLQDLASASMDTVGQKIPTQIISGSRGIIEQTPLFGMGGVLKSAADATMGRTLPQRAIKNAGQRIAQTRANASPDAQKIIDAGLSVFSPRVLGAALNENTDIMQHVPLLPEY